MSFGNNHPIESLSIKQQYAGEVIIGESEKIGFQPIKYQQNADGSNTLVLERLVESQYFLRYWKNK
jgi:hypothetical protein